MEEKNLDFKQDKLIRFIQISKAVTRVHKQINPNFKIGGVLLNFWNKKLANTLTIKKIIYKITIINNKRRRKI